MACRDILEETGSPMYASAAATQANAAVASIHNLAAQFVVDMDANDVIERGFAAKPERQRAAWIEPSRPAGNNAGDKRVRLAANAGCDLVASDPTQGGDLLGDRAAYAGHRDIDARDELAGIEACGMDKKSDRSARTGVPMQHAILNWQHSFLSGERFANDRRKETGRRFVRPAGPHHDARQPNADAIDKATPRIVGEQK